MGTVRNVLFRGGMRRVLPIAVLISALSSIANADPIYTTGFQDPLAQGFTTAGYLADDDLSLLNVKATTFSLDVDALITGAGYWLYDTFDGNMARLEQVRYVLSTDATFSTVVADGMGSITSTSGLTDHRSFGGADNFYTVAQTFDFAAPLLLHSQTTYWFGLVGTIDPNCVSCSPYWANAASRTGGAINLSGTPIPEPSTLIIAGLSLLVMARRRRVEPARQTLNVAPRHS